jgi:CubicO group peptidase (beta-lactamase class C family)
VKILRSASLAGAFALAVFAAACASPVFSDSAIAPAREDVRQIVRSTGSPSFAAAVVKGGRVAWVEAFGDATPRSEFRIGSLTKLFTATALVRLADDGAVSLDASVTKYVPPFPDARVTIRELAEHRAGIRHYGRSDYVNTRHNGSVAEALEVFIHDPLLSVPGEKYKYSSYGYNLLGAALERASAQSFPALLEREVFRPFGMNDTFVVPPPEAASRVVRFFDRDRSGTLQDASPIDLSDRLPSGAYLSTAPDLARFIVGVLGLPEKVRALLFTSGRTTDGKPTNVGLGWRLATDAEGRSYVHHGGESIGGRAFILVYPKEGVGVVLLSNLSFAEFGEKEARTVASRFLP